MEANDTRSIVEALLFSADSPLRIAVLAEVIGGGTTKADIRAAIASLNESYESVGSAVRIEPIAGGVQLLTLPAHDGWVRKLQKTRQRTRVSRAALETLAIVAYRQPITRPTIEEIRGVDAGGVLSTLLERGLVRVAGRAEGPGRPLLYATTPAFLEHFGLSSLSRLPRLDEIVAELDRRGIADDLARELGGDPEDFDGSIARSIDGEPGSEPDSSSADPDGSPEGSDDEVVSVLEEPAPAPVGESSG